MHGNMNVKFNPNQFSHFRYAL